jgi:hypothetical protein
MNEIDVSFPIREAHVYADLERGDALAKEIADDLDIEVGDTGFGFGQRDIAFEVPEEYDLETTAQTIAERMRGAFPDVTVTTHLGDEEDTIRAKWVMDDATTLSEAADMLVGYADDLRRMEREGWQLARPVEDDYGFIQRPRPDAHNE